MRSLQLLLLTIVLLIPPCVSVATPSSVDARLTETEWRLTSFGPKDAPSPVIEETLITIKFAADSKVGGSGGCNSYGGTYQMRGDSLSLSRIISTKRACVQQAAMEQEQRYFEALESVRSVSLKDSQLTIFYDDGRGALNFVKASTQTNRYRLDASQSKFTAHALAGGLLWFKGHDHLIAIRDFTGEAQLTPNSITPASLQIVAKAASMVETSDAFTEPQKQIINKELRELVLHPDQYPEITFRSTSVTGRPRSSTEYDLNITGDLTLHGVTRPINIPTKITVTGNTLRAQGEFSINRGDFKVKATSAVHGLVRVRKKVKFTFDIVGRQQ